MASQSQEGNQGKGEHAESSSLTSVSTLSPASGSTSAPAGVKGNKLQIQEGGCDVAGVNSSLAEESQSLDEFSNGQVVVVKTAALKRSDTFKILKYGKDIIEEDVDVLDTRTNKVIGKLNVSVEVLAALKRILAESKRTSHLPS
ncbi:hypothetical protein HPB50_016918 [Hyalomma asiaticum]|uniref:Uncharacterized protein n=1 Tax=Hyalomma asiaticum TaxID=266040 RepID=A0ACB7TL50_HYAAI|nr:hypothetical protein HPB50_016918 [Hyalomma asiaticum]